MLDLLPAAATQSLIDTAAVESAAKVADSAAAAKEARDAMDVKTTAAVRTLADDVAAKIKAVVDAVEEQGNAATATSDSLKTAVESLKGVAVTVGQCDIDDSPLHVSVTRSNPLLSEGVRGGSESTTISVSRGVGSLQAT